MTKIRKNDCLKLKLAQDKAIWGLYTVSVGTAAFSSHSGYGFPKPAGALALDVQNPKIYSSHPDLGCIPS